MIAISSEEYDLILKKYGKDFMKDNNFVNRDIVLLNPYKNWKDIKDLIFMNNFLRLTLKNVKKTGKLTKKQVKICKKLA